MDGVTMMGADLGKHLLKGRGGKTAWLPLIVGVLAARPCLTSPRAAKRTRRRHRALAA